MRVHQRRHVKPSGSAPRKPQANAPAAKVKENDQSYNGWKNYETWVMAMEVGGNYDGRETYEFWLEEARAVLANMDDPAHEGREAEGVLADQLKSHYDTDAELPELPGVYQDLMNAGLSQVDWYEVARSILEDVSQEEGA